LLDFHCGIAKNAAMRKRLQIALAVFFVGLATVIAWQLLRLREPVYHGKPLSGWLQSYDNAETPEADEALRKIGTNAIPILLENLQAKDSLLKLKLAALGLRYTPSETRHKRAEQGFSALGADASSAVSTLTEIYEQNSSPTARHAAANALVEIGPAAKQAIPALIKSATGTNSEVRAFAVYTLGRMAFESEIVVPVLITSLHDPDREVRYQAAFGLSSFAFMGGDAKAAVPALMEALQDSYMGARCGAAQALGHIHSEPGTVVPALIKSLRDPDAFVRAHVAAALGEFGTNGKPAFGSLAELLHDDNLNARNAAFTALRSIDSEAAARAGVK
jgi:HEAT repeat protein